MQRNFSVPHPYYFTVVSDGQYAGGPVLIRRTEAALVNIGAQRERIREDKEFSSMEAKFVGVIIF